MLIQYLVTTCSKSKNELIKILESLNVCGSILVGNQLCDEDDYVISNPKYYANVYNTKDKGVSKNRNNLIRKAEADYIVFLDDDVSYIDDCQISVEEYVKENRHFKCIRFNVLSKNKERIIPQINKNGFVKFKKLTSFGVWGEFFDRRFLIDNKVFFREDIGPGTENNHGEDAVFNYYFLKKSKIYQNKRAVFLADQSDSTWHGKDRNIEKETISHGYNYYILYGWKARIMSVLFVTTHMWCYPKGTKRTQLVKWMFLGIKKSKLYRKHC